MPRFTFAIAAAIALGADLAPLAISAGQTGAPTTQSSQTSIVMLGTGNPRPDPTAMGPATAVLVGDRTFLFDAGVGVTRQLTAAKISAPSIAGIFFTHLHSDHTLGYPDLIFTTWVRGRNRPLHVYGPRGLAPMTNAIYEAWKEDIDVRTNGLEHLKPGGYRVDVREIEPGVVYDSAGVRITAIAVEHGSWKQAFGYRIDAPDRSIVISGDTRPSEALERAARDIDVLIHEVHPEPPASTPPANARYMREFHTSDVELGKLAATAKPRMLVLYHFGARATAEAQVIATIHAQGYDGRVVAARDLDRF